MDAVEEEHSAVGLAKDRLGPALALVGRGRAVGGKELCSEARDERAIWHRSRRVQRMGGEGAARAFFAFDGRQGKMRRHALHLLNEPAHCGAAASEAVDAGMVLFLIGRSKVGESCDAL